MREGLEFFYFKTPGNDGLPIKLYRTFWNSVGELLVESFNESFIKGEVHRRDRP